MELLERGRAWVDGNPTATGSIRQRTGDFRVDERLGFEASGEGEHVLLQVEKTGLNTVDVANMLAAHAGSSIRDVGYSGLKDKYAVCTQWFTVRCSAGVDWAALQQGGMRILKAQRHGRKLKRGTHRANRFLIRVVLDDMDRVDLERRLDRIRSSGVPNYFGEQRFSRRYAGNLDRLLAGKRMTRTERSMTLSAIRSDLFNRVLDRRVRDGTWCFSLPGEYVNLDGSRSGFAARDDDPDVAPRIAAMDLHPTGPLYGAGPNPASGVAASLEESVLREHQDYCEFLIRQGLKMERRPTRCVVRDLKWRFDEGERILELGFVLGRGHYATSVLREVLDYEDMARAGDPAHTGSSRS